jgi:CDGSH-type Zn-finger protein
MKVNKLYKIKIIKGGPYVVSGGVPLAEKIITHTSNCYELKEGRRLPQSEQYALCRCGHSHHAPFCDGSHEQVGFRGTETASMARYADRARVFQGETVDLMDDGRCAFARFCHRKNGSVWDLSADTGDPENRAEMIKGAGECLTGRLVAREKNGMEIEPDLQPGIDIIQDPENRVSAGIFVKGGIMIEAAGGQVYEPRNRVALCRCGQSDNKPFCDASHVPAGYRDEKNFKDE